jgi:predicted DNA-binding protein
MAKIKGVESLNINIEIKDLPQETNKILNILAKISGSPKSGVIRSALMEYASNHKDEILKFAGVMSAVAEATEEAQ